MLSIILYGRNDAHGYNLHKRAALSLNCLAEVLDRPDDEILFVDYNSPNELPTFPEAIADTLTDACKARLRILRVRPSYHTQFAGRTRLVALESQSRNIAIRRSNPANRWILSTNTDMIFCAADPGQSLSSIVGRLDDGFYHLPRFETPEGFWERLSRVEPQAAIAAMRENGRRFHLNEVVYGTTENIYEAPGDFQLFLKSDLERIDGFDERMLLGWHVDSNIAKRMRLLRGEIGDLETELAGYHCGHTRQATSLHGGDRTENDRAFFVRGLTAPEIPEQRNAWGAPGEPVEEVRLTAPDAYFPALSRAVETSGPAISHVAYNDGSLDQVTYAAEHVLPHLCDLLHNLPPRQTYFFSGDDIALLKGARTYLQTADRDARFVVADEGPSPAAGELAPGIADALPLKAALGGADVLILQFPSADLPKERRDLLEWRCHQVFAAVTTLERARPEALRRRVIFINSVHTSISMAAEQILAPTNTPFSARLRQGFVRDEVAFALKGPEAEVCRRLARTAPLRPEDITYLRDLVTRLERNEPPAGWRRLAPEIGAIATSGENGRRYFGMSDAGAAAWRIAAEEAMRENLARAVAETVWTPDRELVANRLCSGLDWEIPGWAQKAALFMGPSAGDIGQRSRWVWERTSLADAIMRVAPVDPLGVGTAPQVRRILFVADRPDLLAAILASVGYDVSYATSEQLIRGGAGEDWREALAEARLVLPASFQPFDPERREPGFDLFVATLPSLFEKGDADADAILAAAAPMMRQDSHLFCSTTVQLNQIAYEGGFSFAEWLALFEPEGPLGRRGFTAVGGLDERIPMDVVLRFAANDDAEDTTPGLSYGFLKGFNTSAVLGAAWPRALTLEPAERLVYTAAATPERDAAPLPCLGQTPDTVVRTSQVVEADPAAEAAAFLIAHPLPRVAKAHLESGVPALKLQPARNVSAVPSLAPLQTARRHPVGVELSAPGGGGFSIVFDPTGVSQTRITFSAASAAGVNEAIALDAAGRMLETTVTEDGLEIATGDASGPVVAAVRFRADTLHLTALVIGGV